MTTWKKTKLIFIVKIILDKRLFRMTNYEENKTYLYCKNHSR